MKLKKNTVFYSAFTLTLSNIALNALGFLYRLFLSRTTGAEGMGVYQLVMPYYSVILAICVTGLTLSTSRLCAKYSALRDNCAARKVALNSIVIFLSLFSLVAIISTSFSRFISTSILGDARTFLSILIILPCLFCTGIENILKNFFFGTQNLKPPIISEISEQVIRFVAVATLILILSPQNAGHSSALIICGMVISEIASVIILLRFFGKGKSNRTHYFREILSISTPVALSALLNNLLDAFTSVLIPQRLVASGMSPSDAISSFGVIFGMTLPTLALPFGLIGALTTVIIPKMSESLACGDSSLLRRRSAKLLHTTSLLALPSIGFFIALGDEFCALLYNNPAAGNYMLPLCIATLFTFYRMSLGSLLNSIGLQKRVAVISFLSGIILLIGTWFVGKIGIWGFLIADVVSSFIGALLCFMPLKKRLGLSLRLRNWFITPALSSTLSSLCAHFVYITAKGDGISNTTSILCSLITAAAVYFISLKVQGTSLFTYLRKLRS